MTGDFEINGYMCLIGFADLFSLVAPTSDSEAITIESAELELIGDTIDTTATLTVRRMLTDWLITTAGDNQDNVNADESDMAGDTEWASQPDGTAGNSRGGGSDNTARYRPGSTSCISKA